MAEKWTADVIEHPKVAAFNHVALRGPELDDHDRNLINRLVGPCFDLLFDYAAAYKALELSCDEEGEPSEYALTRKAAAWDRLTGEIDSSLLLGMAESRLVADSLFEACGRVGTSERAA